MIVKNYSERKTIYQFSEVFDVKYNTAVCITKQSVCCGPVYQKLGHTKIT